MIGTRSMLSSWRKHERTIGKKKIVGAFILCSAYEPNIDECTQTAHRLHNMCDCVHNYIRNPKKRISVNRGQHTSQP